MAIDVPGGLLVMDQHFQVHNFLQGLSGGVAFDPNQDVMYAVNSGTTRSSPITPTPGRPCTR